jgi:hypothetical protein
MQRTTGSRRRASETGTDSEHRLSIIADMSVKHSAVDGAGALNSSVGAEGPLGA